VILDFSQLLSEEPVSNSEPLVSARKYIQKHKAAFKELAK
jgi:hypothetical protein